MKKRIFMLVVLAGAFLFLSSVALAQGGAKSGPEVARDPDMEKDSLHNLEVARQYFKLRKAYVAALQRCEEILAGNPTFSKIDEVLYIAGKSNLFLADARGKQSPTLYKRVGADSKPTTLTSDEFRSEARDYLSQLVNGYPQSKFKDEALEDLKALGGVKPKDGKQ